MSDKALILRIIEDSNPPSDDDLQQVIALYARPGRTEEDAIDLKATHEDTTQGWCGLLKDLVALSNYGGGVIIFGVDKEGKVIGCDAELASRLDPTNVGRKLLAYAPHASLLVVTYLVTYAECALVIVLVRPASLPIVFDSDGNYQDEKGRTQAAFRKGVIYTRRHGGNEPMNQIEIASLISNLAQKRLHEIVVQIEKVAALPISTDLIAVDPDKPDTGYRVLASGRGIPVEIRNKSEDGVVPLAEVLAPHVPFSDLNAAVAAQVRIWKQASPTHRVDRQALETWYLNRTTIECSSDVAELALTSATHTYGFPMYWASLMSLEHLKQTLDRLIEENDYPDRNFVPYIIAAFFWSERRELLRPLSTHENIYVRSAACRLIGMHVFLEFVRTGRYRAETCNIAGAQYKMSDFVTNRQLAEEVFDNLLQRDIQGELGTDKQVAYQLDILLHARLDKES